MKYRKEERKKFGTNFEAYMDKSAVDEQLQKGKLLEGIIRFNEFNQRIAYVTVDGVKNDIILTSENDQNRALDRDQVVLYLINPRYWEPLKSQQGGADNDKPIETRVIDNDKDRSIVGEGIVITKEEEKNEPISEEAKLIKIQEKQGDDAVDDGEGEDKEDEEGNWITEEEEEVIGEAKPGEINAAEPVEVEGEDLEEGEESENDQDILTLIKKRKAKKIKDKEDKKEKEVDSGLRMTNEINTQEKLKEWLNTVAADFRPRAKVVYIKESAHFNKDMVVILKFGEKKFLQKLDKLKVEEREKLVNEIKSDERDFLRSNKILAVPINKRLRWAVIEAMPTEFWQDMIEGHDPCKRYYL